MKDLNDENKKFENYTKISRCFYFLKIIHIYLF